MIARLLIGPIDIRAGEIKKQLASHFPSGNTNHPDLLYFSSDSKLGIMEARKIRMHFSLKPYSSKGRAVVLEDAGNLTIDAQNALLKTLEELSEEAMIILGSDSDSKFLPTVLSRCQIEILTTNYKLPTTNFLADVEKLLTSSIEERFEYIEKLKDRNEFLHAMVQYFHNNIASHTSSGNVNFMKELMQAEEWVEANVNIRAILEYLMLKMPS